MNEEVLSRQVEKQLDSLRREFPEIPTEEVTALAEAQFGRLRADARITEFIPVWCTGTPVRRFASTGTSFSRPPEIR